MNRAIVNDASCLIDLWKGGLVDVLCYLPYRFVVPLPIRASEVLGFSDQQWMRLDDGGMITHDLTPEEVTRAFAFNRHYPSLSAYDCFCFITALTHKGMLLTGDAQLRRVADTKGLSVHGVLWIIDELNKTETCDASLLINALQVWQSDDTVFLPQQEILKRLQALAAQY